jgi:hypothetical protein
LKNKLNCILSGPFLNAKTHRANVVVLNAVFSKVNLRKVCPNLPYLTCPNSKKPKPLPNQILPELARST